MDELLDTIYNSCVDIVNYEITTFDNSPFTVKTIIIALVFLVLGYLFSKKISHFISKKLAAKFKAEYGEQEALRTLIFYFSLILCVIFVLNIAKIPLTVFTIFGGMLAIGIGFGTQNIMNNFISGVILLLERPITVGDTIEIDGRYGKITEIGARSTKILLPNNTDLIVPNSVLLEQTVINRTWNDKVIRSQITVTLEYGCDIDLARSLMIKAASSIPEILKNPAPNTILSDLGLYGLVFETRIWTLQVPEVSRPIIESKLRFAIYKLLNENGIKFVNIKWTTTK